VSGGRGNDLAESAGPPPVAISAGDVRGIGPEVLLKALAREDFEGALRPIVTGPVAALKMQAREIWPTGIYPLLVAEALDSALDIVLDGELPDGTGSIANLRKALTGDEALAGRWAGRAVERAVALVGAGRARSLVTAPLDKHALNLGGYSFPGHTEMLSHLAGDVEVSMLLAGGTLRVVPATTHVALSKVPSLVCEELIIGQCRVIHSGLRRVFGIEKPRIAVCGLNPHLGDGGVAGDEDQRVIAPAVASARTSGLDVQGPFPADTVFVRAAQGKFDAVLAMYHDQAMVAIKMHSFGGGVNITLGLPYVRTSPDHGTALDIAGLGLADEGSMVEAVRLAVAVARLEQADD
jgi:4-hydroxythreonine-4-phosphate dehydrogenase